MGQWTILDTEDSSTWTMPVNPFRMTSPHAPANITIFGRAPYRTVPINTGPARVMVHRAQPHEWGFTGKIRSEQHYDDFRSWMRKRQRLHITDHLGRTWEVQIQGFDLEELRPNARRPWRYNYEVKALIYSEVVA